MFPVLACVLLASAPDPLPGRTAGLSISGPFSLSSDRASGIDGRLEIRVLDVELRNHGISDSDLLVEIAVRNTSDGVVVFDPGAFHLRADSRPFSLVRSAGAAPPPTLLLSQRALAANEDLRGWLWFYAPGVLTPDDIRITVGALSFGFTAAEPPPPIPLGIVGTMQSFVISDEWVPQPRTPRRIKDPATDLESLAEVLPEGFAAIIEIVVDEKGHVREARVIQGKGPAASACLELIKKWRYEPVLMAGMPIVWKSKIGIKQPPKSR